MNPLDPARHTLAVLAIQRARKRHDAIRALVSRRLGHDLGARQINTVLSVVEPILVALENLLA